MLKSEKTTINGVGYEVRQLPYSIGHKLMLRLTTAVGPVIADALAEAPDIDQDTPLEKIEMREIAPALSAALRGLAQHLSEEDFDFAVETLAEYTEISKSKGKWVPLKQEMEFHFAGNYGELLKWLGFALRVNYLNFSPGQSAIGALLQSLGTKSKSQSQKESTGTSTES
jgi:hypothetical protein